MEWVTISFSRVSSWPGDWTHVSCIADRFFTIWATREAAFSSETWVQFLGLEDTLQKGMTTHFSILAWRITRSSLAGYSPWSSEELDTTERLTIFHFHFHHQVRNYIKVILIVFKQIYQNVQSLKCYWFIAVTLKYNLKLNIPKMVWVMEASLWVMTTTSQDNHLEMAFIQLQMFW